MSTTTRKAPPTSSASRRRHRRGPLLRVGFVVGVAVLGLAAIYANGTRQSSEDAGASGAAQSPSGYAFQVGNPGPGQGAPSFTLASTDGGTLGLDDLAGDRTLLYFQEGLMCQPCWDQLVDIEAQLDEFRALGIDRVVTVTTDPYSALVQKVELEGITTPVLADEDRSVSAAFDTLGYGMMGGSTNGHTFIVLDQDGRVAWRADYGGAPDFTMYLPTESLLTDLRAGLEQAAAT
ncbi:MAG: peroxiredoxin family protein [Egibacteraceae bacterium]